MATQLQGVIQRMAKVNENLEGMGADSETVSEVAKLWRESYQISKEIQNKDDDTEGKMEQQQSSLLVFTRGL
jgi:hypothetical protein